MDLIGFSLLHMFMLGRHPWFLVALSGLLGCHHGAARADTACRISAAQSTVAWQYLRGAAGVRGRVVDVGSLSPLSEALIEVAPGDVRTFTDTAGRFHVPLGRGDYVLRARRLGYETAVDTIALPGLDGFELTIVLAKVNPGLIGCSG